MNYLIFGDNHSQISNKAETSKLFEIAEEYGLPTIWLGDLMHQKDIVRAQVLNQLYNNFKKSKLNHILIAGNHDLINLESTEHSLEPLKGLPNVQIIDRPTSFDNILLVPYTHSDEKLKAALKSNPAQVLIGHFDLRGLDMGMGHILQKGLTFKDLEPFKLSISGHIHSHFQEKNLTYLGSPFSHSFSECNQDKYIAIFDSETLNLELIPTNDLFPRHLSLDFDLTEATPKHLNQLWSKANPKPEDHVRIVLKGTEEQILKFDRSSYPTTVKWQEKIVELESDAVEITEDISNKAMFLSWSKAKELDQTIVDLGLEILKGVG